jgi:hypothetical protein
MAQVLLIAGGLLLAGALLLVFFLVRLIRWLSIKLPDKDSRTPPPRVSYWAIAVAAILLFFSWMLFYSAGKLAGFKRYKPGSAIAILEINSEKDPIKSLKFDLKPIPETTDLKPMTFYLSGNSWKLRARFIRFSGFLKYLFGGSNYYQLSGIASDYRAHKPPGISSAMLSYQPILGGSDNLGYFVSVLKFLRAGIEFNEYESDFIAAEGWARYRLVLSDSPSIFLNSAATSLIKPLDQ